MKIARFLPFLGIFAAASVHAGTFDLYANANAGEYDSSATTVLASDSKAGTGHYSGVGAFGPVSASASVKDPTTGSQVVSTFQNVSANILSETSGSISFNEGWTSNLVNQGYANVYPTLAGSSAVSQYSFNLVGPSGLDVNYSASFTSTGAGTPGFGLWNTIVWIDGVANYPTDPNKGWVTPLSSGSWHFNQSSGGAHTIGFQDFSNVSGGMGIESMQLHETLNFSTAPTPEPGTLCGLGAGALALLRRRKNKQSC